MPNNIDMGGFGSPGLPVMRNTLGAVRVDVAGAGTIAAGPSLPFGTVQNWAVGGASVLSIGTDGWLRGAQGNFSSQMVMGVGASLVYTGFSRRDRASATVYKVAIDSGNAVGGISVDSTSGYRWVSTTDAVGGTADLYLLRDAAGTLNVRNGVNAQTVRFTRSYTDGSNYSWLTHKWNTSTAVIHAEGAGTGSDGSIAFNDAALATNATVGFLMIPSCAGTPSGTPADIPTGQIPMVWDSTNLKLYVYTGGAWKASAAFT